MAVCVDRDRIDLAHVRWPEGGKPQVVALDSYRTDGDESAALSRLRKARRLARYQCVTLLAPGDYQVIQVESPNVPAAELNGALRWCLKDQLDYPIETAIVDAVTIPADAMPSARASQAFAVAARSDTVAARVKPFQQTRVPLSAWTFQNSPNAMLRRCWRTRTADSLCSPSTRTGDC